MADSYISGLQRALELIGEPPPEAGAATVVVTLGFDTDQEIRDSMLWIEANAKNNLRRDLREMILSEIAELTAPVRAGWQGRRE
jgi:hypothetical protein